MARRSRQYEEAETEAGTEPGRPCARGDEWCASRTAALADGKTVTTAARTYRAFCDKDEKIIAACLESVPGVWSRLHRALGDRIVTDTVLVDVSFGPSEPVRLGVDALLRLLAVTMRTWQARTCAAAGDLPPGTDLNPLSPEGVADAADCLRRRIGVFLVLQPAWMSRTLLLPPGRHGQDAVITGEVLDAYGDEEMLRIGADFITTWTCDPDATSAAAAGNEIMRLEYAGRSVLLETPPREEKLLGIPCRSDRCYPRRTLVRALPPQHDGDPEFWSACTECLDTMTAEDYADWVKLNHSYHKARRLADVVAAPGELASVAARA
jgi:hypothetical protein